LQTRQSRAFVKSGCISTKSGAAFGPKRTFSLSKDKAALRAHVDHRGRLRSFLKADIVLGTVSVPLCTKSSHFSYSRGYDRFCSSVSAAITSVVSKPSSNR
jgi:hypothetical protein